ncbi:acetyl-CoA carboxylase family protein [Nocardia brasiliensis]|uniref:acetyl-CoA carboxylase family protein n=1 Tax=Nocardia brasiliensis TaxID=37326 RepID=UPI002454B5FA|nr:carboxyl transferase domain-containing protein [Nocardia brasiliensis]
MVVVNRGEVAVRVLRTARERGWGTVAVCTAEESGTMHARLADEVVQLPGTGAGAYLDVAAVVAAARQGGPGALVHPGYGFLSESAELADACAAAELIFVGPSPQVLRIFGDKVAARAAAERAGVPVPAATSAGSDVAAIAELLAAHPDGVMVKAVSGGGGRGMREVRDPALLDETYERCRAEASAGFGDDTVYAEALISAARHIEVQVVADGVHAVALGDRDCSVQRRHQKLIEIAPAPNLDAALRERLHRDAVRLAESVGCRGVLTVEFLVRDTEAWFLEVNPRLQVEHTVTEEVTGLDLVALQLDLALGATLADLDPAATPSIAPVGSGPSSADIHAANAGQGEAGPGDAGQGGAGPDDAGGGDAGPGDVGPGDAGPGGAGQGDAGRGDAGPGEAGRGDAGQGEAGQGAPDTLPGKGFADRASTARGYAVQARVNAELVTAGGDVLPSTGTVVEFAAPTGSGVRVDTAAHTGMRQGAQFDSLVAKVIARGASYPAALRRCSDALSETVVRGIDTNLALLRAVLDSLADGAPVSTSWFEENLAELAGRASSYASVPHSEPSPVTTVASVELGDDESVLRSPMGGTLVSLVEPGTVVAAGAEVAVLEAMKMQHVLRADEALRVRRHLVAPGATVDPHAPLLIWAPAEHDGPAAADKVIDLDALRPDLAEVYDRHRVGRDEARPEAVAKRHRLGRRTARENIADLVDDDSFVEYGALAVAAQRLRRTAEDLIANTPADGLIGGMATVNADRFGADRARVVVMSYDYTVLAGTQGMRNHTKTDRLLELARAQGLPVVFYTEGGGGRPGDTDHGGISGLDVTTFRAMGALSGQVPLLGLVSGRCFAGNAALLGMCDVVIATPDANIGMGGPAMIEGGGLGVYAPEDIGPIEVQRRNGVVHIVAADEAEAARLAQRYLAYFQGPVDDWAAPDPRLSRHVVPENRLHAFDIRAAIAAVADVGSVLELRAEWAVGIVTALIRVEGQPYGLIANNCHHLGGAIDAPAADKLSAFLRLCDSHRLPIVSLCDTPGFMVGPDAEKEATVTKFSRLFIDAAGLSVPWGTIILRKGYGLGAQAMAAGSFRAPRFVIAWPTGEIGGMGLEGAVRLGFAKELAAIEDPTARQQAFDNLVSLAYASGRALTAATALELDDVIDPADTRRWIRTLG